MHFISNTDGLKITFRAVVTDHNDIGFARLERFFRILSKMLLDFCDQKIFNIQNIKLFGKKDSTL